MTAIRLGGGPEFDRIRAIAAVLGDRASELGGDVAWVEVGGQHLALSTDVSVEGVHFRRDWLTAPEIGWRAGAAALSDLAAAGAEALGVLAALTAPAHEEPGLLAALMDGVGAAASSVGARVLGGDLSRGGALSLAITVVGVAERTLRRSGAAAGDGLWVTGDLGGARAALTAWRAGRAPDAAARARFARPEPRLAAGAWLAERGASAMLDLSDGLGGDAGHLAAASGVRLRIALERLPVHPAVAAEASALGEAPELFATRGGEDFELLAAMPPAFAGASPFPLTRIGEVETGRGVALELGGRPQTIPGYDHFA
jgi:thiamine-monophosphate kinase